MGFLSTLGTIGGGIVGFATGGPAGALAGARVGGGLGGRLEGGTAMQTFTSGEVLAQGGIGGQQGIGYQRCPPGTRCVGFGIGGACVGSCVPYNPPTVPTEPPTGLLPPGGFLPPEDYQPPAYQQGGNGTCPTNKCQINGKMGRLNQSGYWVYGRCGSPANASYVAPGTKCVSPRRLNPANGQAALRAIRRVEATHNLLKRIDKRMMSVARRSTRGGRSSVSRKAPVAAPEPAVTISGKPSCPRCGSTEIGSLTYNGQRYPQCTACKFWSTSPQVDETWTEEGRARRG